MSYTVKALYLSGKNSKIHKSGETLKVDDIPGGKESADKLIKSGHLVASGKGKTVEDSSDELTPKEQADMIILEAKELQESGDLIGALEKLESVKDVYPTGKKAPKLIKEIQGLLGE